MARRVLILGAAGRDFHDFAMLCRDDPDVEVVAFTATQIPGIDRRRFPAVLAGPRYPRGIPIFPEADLETLCQSLEVDEVLFAYSDVTHAHVMHLASRALACGASFALPGPRSTMISAARPVVAVSAVRTGCGKSQVARWAAREIAAAGLRVAVIRHPMPYGDLARQRVQRNLIAMEIPVCRARTVRIRASGRTVPGIPINGQPIRRRSAVHRLAIQHDDRTGQGRGDDGDEPRHSHHQCRTAADGPPGFVSKRRQKRSETEHDRQHDGQQHRGDHSPRQ